MKWYEITGLAVIWFLGLYLRGKFHEFRRNYHYNTWRKKGLNKKRR